MTKVIAKKINYKNVMRNHDNARGNQGTIKGPFEEGQEVEVYFRVGVGRVG
jgi:hypothetical protein